jgi:carbon monoxide dehydrogenase subunit G
MPTITAESSAIIGRSLEDVWAFVSDPRNEPRWHTDILEIKSASDPAGGPPTNWVHGATLLVTVQFMGRREYEVEITGLEASRRLQFTTRTGPVKPISTYLLESADGQTRFTRHVDLPLHGPMRILAPLMRRDVEKRNARFVENLKALLEQ